MEDSHSLAELLATKSGADSAEVVAEAASFRFYFRAQGGGVSVVVGSPWALLNDKRKQPASDPRLDAEALFNKEGFVRIGEEEAQQQNRRFSAVREAVGLAWHQYMLPAFARVVYSNAVMVYARVQAPSAPFDRVPSDVWRTLDVIDWENGVALAPDRTAYWSLHVAFSSTSETAAVGSAALRRPKQEGARRALSALYPHGTPDPAAVPNKVLCGKVREWLSINQFPPISSDSVLRAAGRRK